MVNYLTAWWRRSSGQDSKVKAEVERIASLQKTAADRRAEYSAEKEQAAPNALSSSRKRMEEAEAAHVAALQAWDNKQARQKSW